MSAADRRILDCHAAWVHGCLTTEELHQEIWANSPPEYKDADSIQEFGRAVVRHLDAIVFGALQHGGVQ